MGCDQITLITTLVREKNMHTREQMPGYFLLDSLMNDRVVFRKIRVHVHSEIINELVR